jgi:hypothetical protein
MVLRRPCPALEDLADITWSGGWRAYQGRGEATPGAGPR